MKKIFSTLKFILTVLFEGYLILSPSDERRLSIWERRLEEESRGRQRQWLINKARKKIGNIYSRSDDRRAEVLVGWILCIQNAYNLPKRHIPYLE